MAGSVARVLWCCLVLSGILISQAQDVDKKQQTAKPQATPQSTKAGAPVSPTYLPEGRSHRKDLDDSYGSRSGSKSKRYPSFGEDDEPYPSYGPVKPPVFVREECINDIDEFAEAFNKGSVNRCVNDRILVRLDQWFEPLNATTKDKLFRNFVQKQARTVTFWSYGDNPEKYIRIGRDALTLGNFVDNPPANNTGLQNGSFEGLLDFSNFAGLLESIGYSSVDTRPKAGYMMVITYKPTKRIRDSLPLPVYQPTWKNILTYIQWFISKVAAADDKAGREAGVIASDYSDFKFSRETLKLLETKTFSELTGCQAQCTVQDTNFGNPNDETWDAPCLEVKRLSSNSCNKTVQIKSGKEVLLSPDIRYEFTEPTAVNAYDDKCSPQFQNYRNKFTYSSFCGAGATNATKNRALALQVAEAYESATWATDKVLILRAYLLSSCAGTFNALFTGNGFTASGNGGFWQATGTEIHTGEVTTDKLPDAFPRVRVLFFCPYAQNGLPYTHAICPQSIVGTLNVSSILKEPAININKAWDVQEVFHPLDPAKPLTSGSYRPKRDNRVVNTQGEPKQG